MGELLNMFCCFYEVFCSKNVAPLSVKQGWSGKKCCCNTMLATQISEIS